MKLINKMYSVKVCEYDGWSLNRIIDIIESLYSLEDAIYVGKSIIRDYCYESIFENTDFELLPDDVTDNELESFIANKRNENKSYSIIIEITSGNRKQFETSKELMDYFNNNIKNISNEELYDFLLSLVVSESREYDYSGEFISSKIWEQCPTLERAIFSNVNFNEQDCLNGIYTFEYQY